METLQYLDTERALCVVSSYTMTEEPTLVTLYWPVWRNGSRMNAECYALGHGLTAARADGGSYGYSYDSGLSESARRTIFQLENGPRTEAIKVDKTPVPPPKVRRGIETRWYHGAWEKYLKSAGWVRA